MHRVAPILLAFSLASAVVLPLTAADGDLDTDFAGDGSTYWAVVNGFFFSDVATTAVVPGDHELFLVATRKFNGNNVAFRAFDRDGEPIDDLACESSTEQIIPFSVDSRGLAAGLSDSGQLLVAGGISFDGSEDTERAFIAQFDRAAGGCALDTDFSTAGFAFFDDFSFCDTESCSVLALAQIRRPTLAVTATRIILLVRSEVSGPKGRLFLVGLTADGEVDNGFDGNGVLEILAPGHDGFYAEAHMALDARGRIYVLAAPFKEGGVTDSDLFLFRYLPGGGLDNGFSGDGVLPLVEANSTDSTADDLRIASDGRALVSGGVIGGATSFVRAVSTGGVAGTTVVETLQPAQVATQGNGFLVTSSEFLPKAGDGGRTRRRELATTGTFSLDSTWGGGGTADFDYDYDPGDIEVDQPRHFELWGGRPVIVGGSSSDAGVEITFAIRLQNRYIFADGFEQGRATLWSTVVTP